MSMLRPFFKHYGSKWALSRYVAPPVFPLIAEPFAGAAGYSCRYGAGRRVRLYDADPDVVEVWRWLLGARPADVRALPSDLGDADIRELGLDRGAMLLIQRWLTPQGSTTNWWMPPSSRGMPPGARWSTIILNRIEAQLPAIRGWSIDLAQYEDVPVERATWVVDPPYQGNRSSVEYGARVEDYDALGAWCRKLPGQVIVHEQVGAGWLPFRLLKVGCRTGRTSTGRMKQANEVVWTRGL